MKGAEANKTSYLVLYTNHTAKFFAWTNYYSRVLFNIFNKS